MKNKVHLNELDEHSPVDDAVIIVRPHFEAVTVAGRNVAQNVHLLALQFSALQLVNKPLQLLSWIRAVQQQPPDQIQSESAIVLLRDKTFTADHEMRLGKNTK